MTNIKAKALEEVLRELQEYKRMADEIAATIDGLTDQVKDMMGEEESALVGAFKVTYKTVTQSRLDSTALKKAMPDVAAQFTKTVTTRPLRIS